MAIPKLNLKFPRPLAHEWIKFEQNLPEGSSCKALQAAVHLDSVRRDWSAHTARSYANELDQYVRWLKRTGKDAVEPTIPSVYAWRGLDQGDIVHPSIWFEHAMVHLVLGLMNTITRVPAQGEFDIAKESIQHVRTYRADHTSAYIKHLISDCEKLCAARQTFFDMGETQTTTKLTETINLLPNVARASNLYPYVTEFREYLTKQLCIAHAEVAAAREDYSVADAAASMLGDEHDLRMRYRKLRTTTLQPELTFDDWLFSITEPEEIKEEPQVSVEVAHFDNLDLSDES